MSASLGPGPRRRVPWLADVVGGLIGGVALATALTAALLRLLESPFVGAPVSLPDRQVLLLVAGVAALAGASGGGVTHLGFRAPRPVEEGMMLWRSRVSSVAMMAVLAGGVTTTLLLPWLLPVCLELMRAGADNPMDSFLGAAFPLLLAGGLSGALGAVCAALLHLPARGRRGRH